METGDGTVHFRFKLNGISYTLPQLRELAYNLVKEGSSFEKSIGNFLADWLNEKPTISVSTSGSTGTPKNILLQKGQMANSALATGNYFDLKVGNTALLCLPADYIAGKMMLVRAMVLGLELDYVEPSSNPLAELSKTYDFAAMVPLQLENSLEKIENIKTLIVGGAALSRKLHEKIQKKRTAVFETYGMTETITHIAVKRINGLPSSGSRSFKAISNVSFSIDDRDCLVITAPHISNKPVITNDIVDMVSETEFEWLGRIDNVINSGGVKLFPEQIEAKLISFLNHRFFVAGLPNEILGEKLVLVVEGDMKTDELLQLLKESDALKGFEIPKNVYKVSKFIETETGKIHRKKSLGLVKF
ncbi:O-succinylbenzoic acid--CoA ligase [Maribacter algarum]|uniref:O-succinylbenzoic acid--CoA ligase n=2 Tax=Maribacter algarum (ex Zhang et al. 2020) TaxID=2578118 RepID=A0A5S3PS79_9FLAO|nr:O-succinylbenzoic acid--CoA ligase [Maribacter algarum]